jgi:hypothetical protein
MDRGKLISPPPPTLSRGHKHNSFKMAVIGIKIFHINITKIREEINTLVR